MGTVEKWGWGKQGLGGEFWSSSARRRGVRERCGKHLGEKVGAVGDRVRSDGRRQDGGERRGRGVI